jgi:type IV pilus assembly protein PilQ
MEQRFKFLIRNKSVILGICTGLLWLLVGNIVWAKAPVQLKSFEVQSSQANKIQLLLEFSGPAVLPRNFSVESPPTMVFDFASVQNALPKEQMNQSLTGDTLKNVTFVEVADKNRMRMVLDVQHVVPFEQEVNGHILKITLNESIANPAVKMQKKTSSENGYAVKSFDFRRGESGEARIIVGLSNSEAMIDFKEDGNKIITEFAGATMSDALAKQYNVTDFATPVQDILLFKEGENINMVINAIGDYDKIAYQMDNQFIVEVRGISKEEKVTLQELTGHYSGQKISLNFQDIEVRAILQIIADFSGFNVITSDNVKGSLTLRLQNVPWDQALDIILQSQGLDKRQIGNVMLIGPTEQLVEREKVELQGQKQMEDLGPMKSELIQVNYANADDLANLLKDKSNSFMTSRGNVNVDKRTNTLLVQDLASKLSEIRALLKKLDVPVRQVEISTQIVTADNTLESTLGLRFGGGANVGLGHRRLGVGSEVARARAIGDFTDVNQTGAVKSAMPQSNRDYANPPQSRQPDNFNIIQGDYNKTFPMVNNTEGLFSDLSAVTSVSGTQVGKLGLALAKLPNGTLLDLEIQALEYESKSKTIARPKLVTMDQNKAIVEQGVDIPYTQATSSGATSVTYKTAALKLEVTPHITPNDKISLDLSISNDNQGPNAPAGPVVNTNRLATKVLVENGETVVLGGVLQITDNKQWAKIPFFGDLPIVGSLFRNKYANYSPKELIIFLTPKIINPVITNQ